MSSNYFGKALAGAAAVLASVGLAFSISGISIATAAGEVSSSATVATVPQCVWQINGASTSINMNHTEFDDGHTKYVGQDFGLSGADTNSVQVFVGPSAAGAVSTDADNCAWYGVSNSAGSGANVTYSLPETPTFTSRTANFANDNSLGFDLDGNPTTGSNTKQLSVVLTKSGCTNAAASTLVNGWSGIDLANLYGSGATLSLTAAQLAKSLTSTSSSCTWTTKLSTYVPGGNTPAHDADTYTFTGPTITTTLTASGIYG